MKIKKFTKSKNGMYIITLEDSSKFKVHEDLILKYNLLLTKEITPELKEKLYEENKSYEIYDIALKYISTKIRSKKEIINYLKIKNYSNDNISLIVDMLIKQGYLNDEIYTNSLIHDRILLSSDGPNKIRLELEKNGIDNNIIEKGILVFTEELEKERINKIVDKLVKTNHNKGAMLLKRKIQNYLLNLGYNVSLVNESLNGKKLVSNDLYKQEYDKLYKNLSKKYSGKELEFKLRQKLYQKGFSNDDFY